MLWRHVLYTVLYVVNIALFRFVNPFAPDLHYEDGAQGRYNQILSSTPVSLNVGGISALRRKK